VPGVPVSSFGHDLHLVLCDFGAGGQAFAKVNLTHADRKTVICELIAGEYEAPLAVVAINLAEGWARDVSGAIAQAIKTMVDDAVLTAGTRAFVRTHLIKIAPLPDDGAGQLSA
jgi:hypothetical protein